MLYHCLLRMTQLFLRQILLQDFLHDHLHDSVDPLPQGLSHLRLIQGSMDHGLEKPGLHVEVKLLSIFLYFSVRVSLTVSN